MKSDVWFAIIGAVVICAMIFAGVWATVNITKGFIQYNKERQELLKNTTNTTDAGLTLAEIDKFVFNDERFNASTYSAYYQNGRVRAIMINYQDLDAFLSDMVHEYAHHYYETKFTRQMMKDWLNLTKSCKFESDYPWTRTMSQTTKIYEEWAMCVQHQYEGSTKCCPAKRDFITKTGILTPKKI